MKLDGMRSAAKRVLAHAPVLYALSARIYVTSKERLDRMMFERRHPGVPWIRYTPDRIQAFYAAGFRSQYGQDQYLWELLGRPATPGFYVDIGGNEPVALSNSYFFEKQGWSGVAFDPLSRVEAMWRAERTAQFHRAAIADRDEMREFVEILPRAGWEHALSGFAEYVRQEDRDVYGSKSYMVRAAPLAAFLPSGRTVDLLFIDVEGAENIVLDGIDFASLRPRYLMIENVSDLGGSEAIRARIVAQGYELCARLGAADDVFRRV